MASFFETWLFGAIWRKKGARKQQCTRLGFYRGWDARSVETVSRQQERPVGSGGGTEGQSGIQSSVEGIQIVFSRKGKLGTACAVIIIAQANGFTTFGFFSIWKRASLELPPPLLMNLVKFCFGENEIFETRCFLGNPKKNIIRSPHPLLTNPVKLFGEETRFLKHVVSSANWMLTLFVNMVFGVLGAQYSCANHTCSHSFGFGLETRYSAVASPIRSAQTIRLPATTANATGLPAQPTPAPILKEHLTFAALFRAI
ncbi:hypothetical protein TNCV_1550541 [Trichonephila clavipes]|nr:hypothetical protein TNCV_1550541 [Trichonephila clavipes]